MGAIGCAHLLPVVTALRLAFGQHLRQGRAGDQGRSQQQEGKDRRRMLPVAVPTNDGADRVKGPRRVSLSAAGDHQGQGPVRARSQRG